MNFRIVSKHSNMSHDGDLLRSDLYNTTASKDMLDDVIKLTSKYDLCFSDRVDMILEMLKVLNCPAEKIECDMVIDISK